MIEKEQAFIWSGKDLIGMAFTNGTFEVNTRAQVLTTDTNGYNTWVQKTVHRSITPRESAILICDMWDRHWSRGAEERCAALAPRVNQLVSAARSKGVLIVHSPSDTMDFYAGTPARQRALEVPQIDLPISAEHQDPPMPIDASDGGSDSGETVAEWVWTRQHPAIEIDQDRDMISDGGEEVYRCLKSAGRNTLFILGVHTNFCVLNRSFGIKQMVRWGIDTILVRDLTDAMYNPAMPPYVSHAEGTELVIQYIEKFWCPSVTSDELG